MDKWMHSVSGLLVFFSCMYMGMSDVLGALMAVAAGLLKELWDSLGHGDPDPWDFVATVFPVFIIIGGKYLIEWLLRL